jgi:hypothetical protein
VHAVAVEQLSLLLMAATSCPVLCVEQKQHNVIHMLLRRKIESEHGKRTAGSSVFCYMLQEIMVVFNDIDGVFAESLPSQ